MAEQKKKGWLSGSSFMGKNKEKPIEDTWYGANGNYPAYPYDVGGGVDGYGSGKFHYKNPNGGELDGDMQLRFEAAGYRNYKGPVEDLSLRPSVEVNGGPLYTPERASSAVYAPPTTRAYAPPSMPAYAPPTRAYARPQVGGGPLAQPRIQRTATNVRAQPAGEYPRPRSNGVTAPSSGPRVARNPYERPSVNGVREQNAYPSRQLDATDVPYRRPSVNGAGLSAPRERASTNGVQPAYERHGVSDAAAYRRPKLAVGGGGLHSAACTCLACRN